MAKKKTMEENLVVERDIARTLARALAKALGGKLREHADDYCFGISGERLPMNCAFSVDGRLAGRQCQLQIGSDGFTLSVFGLRFLHPELVIFRDEKVVLKPNSENEEALIIDAKGLTDAARNKFSSRFGLLEKLNLRGYAEIAFGHDHAQLISCGAGPNEAIARLNVFTEFLQTICKAPQEERLYFDSEWLLKPLPKRSPDYNTTPHHFGGKLDADVACPFCKSELTLMAELDLSDRALPKTLLKELPVFWCFDCAYWDATFFDLSGKVPRPLAADRTEAGQGDDTGPLDVRPLTLVPVPKGKKAGRKSKLGGKPVWVQGDETPDCPQCTKAMAFALQLASDSHVTYADMGFLYAFVCPECRITASLVQSH